jgi:carbon-monoxide dehydrogenase large subunit
MGQFGIGQPVRRTEDERLLTGRAAFLDDINVEGQAAAALVRSPHAHALVKGIDSAAAHGPGVLAIYTGRDIAEAGFGPLPCIADAMVPFTRKDGSKRFFPERSALAVNRVSHVGDPVAIVIAETAALAREAAEAVAVDYEPLPAVTDTATATDEGTPQIWEEAPRNIALDWAQGDAAATEAAFAEAAHITSLDLVNNRVICASIETRGAIGAWDAGAERYTLTVNTQNVHQSRDVLAQILGVDPQSMRVVSSDVGGAFGMKGFVYPEYPLLLWAAKQLGRPVKWSSDRAEAFVTDTQGRDHVTRAELALDKAHKFLALRVSTIANLGAYAGQFGPGVPTLLYTRMLPGIYTIPALHAEVAAVLTNTVCVDAYRGAGRPEAAYVIERIIDKAARELGLSPAELRRSNFIPPSAMPFTTVSGLEYDSGDFARTMDAALAAADWNGFETRRAEAKERGCLHGIGLATYIEATGADPTETANIAFEDDGTISLKIGTLAAGQGHLTTFAQIAADALGVPFDKIAVSEGDSDALPQGGGTAGSRSVVIGGGAVEAAAEKIKDKALKIAAHMLEAAEADIEFQDGAFTIAGTDRSIGIMEIGAAARDAAKLPDGMEPGLDETESFLSVAPTFPSGAHICEVDIEADTGAVQIVGYWIVDDFGTVINPLLVDGQVHGGVAQGIGQVLLEMTAYDAQSGQLVTGSFMDYGMPRAADLPFISVATKGTPCQTNAMGVKGAGEAGTLGALPAVVNALVDALAPLGIDHIDMPATPERVWQAMRKAAASR